MGGSEDIQTLLLSNEKRARKEVVGVVTYCCVLIVYIGKYAFDKPFWDECTKLTKYRSDDAIQYGNLDAVRVLW